MLNLLRKLGILRYGVKTGKYTSAKDMPTEFLMNDVANAEKDLVNKQDVEKVRETIKTSRGKKILKWVILSIVGFLGVCFVLGMLFGTDESPKTEKVANVSTESVTPAAVTLAETPRMAPAPVTPADGINRVFWGVRQANLDEDLHAFMTFYAPSFPDRAGKEQKTRETWQKFDFASLEFFVFDLQIDGNRAQASVGWEIALLEQGGDKPKLIETTNDVVLEKGGTGWQIVSLQ